MASGAEEPAYDFVDHDIIAKFSRLNVRPRGLAAGNFTGLHRSSHHGASVEFAEYRKYVPGDDTRRIDWRVYAKSDRFYLKEFEADTNLRCYLVIDCSGSMTFASDGMSKFEYARRLAATLAHLLVHQADHVGVLCFNDQVVHDIPPRGNPAHLRFIYDTIDRVKPRGKTDMVEILHGLAERISQRAMVVLFSDFFVDIDPLISCFEHMRHRKHDLVAFHLLDRQETEFEFDRPIRFQDLEGGSALMTEPVAIQPGYRVAVDNFLSAMRHGCRQHNVDYQLTMTSEPTETALTRFFLSRAKRWCS